MSTTYQPWQPSGAARFFGVILLPQTWRNLAYLLLAFPLGTAYFILIVTGFSLGLGLMVTLLGIPVLLATLVAVRACAAFERGLTNALLGTAIPQVPIVPAPAPGIVPRIIALITSPTTWKDLLYVFLEFPFGILTFSLGLTLVTIPPYFVFLPIYYRWTDFYYAPYHRVNSFADALFFVPIGVLLVPVVLHAINGMAALYRAYAYTLLYPTELTASSRDRYPTM
jgi:hypothetical protein